MSISKIKEEIPDYVYRVADKLLDSGFEAFLAGGAVKDLLLGREPKDYDLATDAIPRQVEKIFPGSVATNARFGTVLVIMDDKQGERFDVEVTTYRKEEEYVGGRWPSKVEFTSEIEQDLSRRDFTINAMALNLARINSPSVTTEELLIDPFGGQDDLIKAKRLRAVRDPLERFSEDGLRGYRACRLAAELGFEIDSNTFGAISSTLHIARKISIERVRDELIKLLQYAPKPSVGIELMRESGLLELFLPELLELRGIEQPEWHVEDVYNHSLNTLDMAEDSIKLASLLHDVGKGRTRSEDEKGVHFFSHDVVGAEMTREILTRLRFPKRVVEKTASLVRWHMFYYPSADWRKDNEVDNSLLKSSGGWTDGAIRRFIKNVGVELIEDLFRLRIADAASNPKSVFNPLEIQALENRISEVRAKEMVLKISDLDISGEDLKGLGIKSGPVMGNILNQLLDRVIDEPFLNERGKLLDIVTELRKGIDTE